jgi:hypothetical protein
VAVACRQLEEYFAHRRSNFNIRTALPAHSKRLSTPRMGYSERNRIRTCLDLRRRRSRIGGRFSRRRAKNDPCRRIRLCG